MQFEPSLLPPAAETALIPDLQRNNRDTLAFGHDVHSLHFPRKKGTFENTIGVIKMTSRDSRLEVNLIKCSKRRTGMGQS